MLSGGKTPWADREVFAAAGKEATLYLAYGADAPLIVLNSYAGDGSSVIQAMAKVECGNCNLLSIGALDWNHDMSPWECPPLSDDDSPCTGGADDYLSMLLGDILPQALARVEGEPSFLGIAGYSLAGLFALYAAYRCNVFTRIASISGSLWFPDFRAFATAHEMACAPERMYLSVGDHEERSSNPLLRTVQDNTEALASHYRALGIDVAFELNPGNHFKHPSLRTAKGVASLVGWSPASHRRQLARDIADTISLAEGLDATSVRAERISDKYGDLL